MPAFSHSRIETFKACKLQYKYSYIEKVRVEREDTVEAFLGSLVHDALEKLYRNLQYEKRMTASELIEFFHSQWQERWNDKIVIVKSEFGPENYKKMGERYLRDYYDHYQPFDQGRVIGIETQNFLSLDDKGVYKYHVRIDRLMDMGEGVYEVHDYKTNKALPTQESLDQDRQLAMYSLWVRRQYKDFKKVKLVWHFLAFDKEMESFRTEEQLEQLRQEILDKINEIENAKDFPAHVSYLCDWCLYKDICPMWKHETNLEALPNNEYMDDPGLKLVDEYVKTKEELDTHKKEAGEKLEKLKQAIVGFCQREDIQVVVGTEKKLTLSASDFVKLPAKNTPERNELEDQLRKMGRYDEVAALDVYALAKIMQNQEWSEAERENLKKYASSETSYRLSISKRKNG